MKRIISLLLSIAILLISANVTPASENAEEVYNTVSVEFSDNIGMLEKIQVMVKDDNVYGNAEELGIRLGYSVDVSDEYVAIYNKEADENIPYGLTIFYYDSTKVEHMLLTKMVDKYEAPFQTIKNENGVWIPLEYSLLLLNSSMLVVDNTILIDMPSKNIIDIYMDIMKNNQKYQLYWQEDIGLSEKNEESMGKASYVITLFNGILNMDGESWTQLITYSALGNTAYDSKYGEKLAVLFCTYSNDELSKDVNEMKKLMSHFNGKGTLGKSINAIDEELDKDIGNLMKTSNALKDKIDMNNKQSIVAYNKSYQALENACDKADLFSEATELYSKVGKGVSDATSILDKFYKVAEVVGFASEFQNQDNFAVNALSEYIESADSQGEMSWAMKDGIRNYTGILQTDIATYSALRYLSENYDDLVFEAMDLVSSLGLPARLMLIAWDVMSSNIPFYKEGLSNSDNFMISMYASMFQADSFMSYQMLRNSTFNDVKNITPDNLYVVSQYCYTYLKSCYITRNAALGSLNEETKSNIPSTINYQKSINEEIAGYLVQLKNADTTNESGCYGFLPGDNEEYLKSDNEEMLNIVKTTEYTEKVLEEYNEFISRGDYDKYTDNWESTAQQYAVLDINNDGVAELLINSENMVDGWYYTLIFSYDIENSRIVLVDDIYNYGGISYSVEYNAIMYTDIKPFSSCGLKYFYELTGNVLKFRFSVGYETDDKEKYYYYDDGETENRISKSDEKRFFDNIIYPDFIDIPKEEVVSNIVEMSDYLHDDSVNRIANAVGELEITRNTTYKECVTGRKLTIGILADASVEYDPEIVYEYNQITDIVNSGNVNVSLYGVCIEDSIMQVKKNLAENYGEIHIEEQGNGIYNFWLGDAAVICAKFNNDKLVSYEYKLRYTS